MEAEQMEKTYIIPSDSSTGYLKYIRFQLEQYIKKTKRTCVQVGMQFSFIHPQLQTSYTAIENIKYGEDNLIDTSNVIDVIDFMAKLFLADTVNIYDLNNKKPIIYVKFKFKYDLSFRMDRDNSIKEKLLSFNVTEGKITI